MSRNKTNGPSTTGRKNKLCYNYSNHRQRTSVLNSDCVFTLLNLAIYLERRVFRVHFFFLRKECWSEFPWSTLWLFVFLIKVLPLIRDIYCLYFHIHDDSLYAHINLLYCSLFELLELTITLREPLSYWQITWMW